MFLVCVFLFYSGNMTLQNGDLLPVKGSFYMNKNILLNPGDQTQLNLYYIYHILCLMSAWRNGTAHNTLYL